MNNRIIFFITFKKFLLEFRFEVQCIFLRFFAFPHSSSIIRFTPGGEPRLELGVHRFGIMWNYFGIHQIIPLHPLSSWKCKWTWKQVYVILDRGSPLGSHICISCSPTSYTFSLVYLLKSNIISKILKLICFSSTELHIKYYII